MFTFGLIIGIVLGTIFHAIFLKLFVKGKEATKGLATDIKSELEKTKNAVK